MYIKQSFTLQEELVEFLEDLKAKYKIAKSIIIQCLVRDSMKDPENLYKLIIGDN